MSKFAVIMPAAGKSSRFHDKNYKKPFAPLADRAVWLHSAEKFLNRGDVKQLILVISPEDREEFHLQVRRQRGHPGHRRRRRGRRAGRFGRQGAGPREARHRFRLRPRRRPALPGRRVDHQVFEAAEKAGAAILAIPVAGTLKRVGAGSQDRRDRFARRPVGSADAAGLSPADCCSKPTPSAAAFRPPTTPNWSSGSATP